MPGLQNLGNTCYLNASLQCLAAIDNYDPGKGKIGGRLQSIFKGLRDPNPATVVVPSKLIPVLPDKFKHGMQHDAHELIVLLLEMLEKENGDKPHPLFDGKYNTEVKCKECKKKSITKTTFNVLTVDVYPKFAKSLEMFQSSEQIEPGAYECEFCKKKVDASKRFILKKWPEVGIFHLSRFSAHSRFAKRNDLVQFPYLFKLSNSIKYELIGVVNHMGVLGGGHYNAYVKRDNEWYLADDSRYMKVSKDKVVSQSAYILFYRQVEL